MASTALLDALGRLIVTAGERLAALPEAKRPGSVVVGVMTDGYENASQDWTHERIKALIEQQTREYHWEFLYLGADQDAIEEGSKMGFAVSKSVTYRRGKADKVMADMGANVGAYSRRTGGRNATGRRLREDRAHQSAARRRGGIRNGRAGCRSREAELS